MRSVSVICVGKLKEKYWREAEAEYLKRLQAYCDLHIAEVKDEQAGESLSEAEKEHVKEAEAEKILKKIPENTHVIALTIEGRRYDSPAFANRLRVLQEEGDGRLCFIIGGSLGLHARVLDKADEELSFSALTFPHQLARIMLLEQIYRGYRIRSGAPYHK